MKIAILGAGVSGLSLARMLCEGGLALADITLFEADAIPGGLCRSKTVDGFTYDVSGGHILFSKDRAVMQWMKDQAGGDAAFVQRERHTKIRFGNRFVHYPFENGLGDLPELAKDDAELREWILARRLEAALSKARIFEIYLNVIEWGDGVWGAEAAARRYFGSPASSLTPSQAALLAGAIVNPRVLTPARPTRRLLNRQRIILSRMGGVTPPTQSAAEIERPPALAAVGVDAEPPSSADDVHEQGVEELAPAPADSPSTP